MKGRLLACACASVAAVAGAGCGATSEVSSARPQVVNLGWRENCGTRADPILISTLRLTIGGRRWRVDLSFRNRTGVTLLIVAPHPFNQTLFGLEVFKTSSWHEVLDRARTGTAKPQLVADRFVPSQPLTIAPGETWSGSFSGLGRLPVATPIRVVLGRFVIEGAAPPDFINEFLCISKRVIRLEHGRKFSGDGA